MKKTIACLQVFLLVFCCAHAQPRNAKTLVGQMTLQEKAKLVVGMGFKLPEPPKGDTSSFMPPGFVAPPEDPEYATLPQRVPGAAGRTHAIARLGIPSITVSDGPAGVRIDSIRNNDHAKTYYATAFPVATLLASSWDTALVKKVGEAFGSEVHEYGVDVLLAPGMNIHRNPLGGRNFEYYSEDPLVAGKMAAAIVKGIQSNGVGTSIKHFAANNQESNRMGINETISERAMREIYLRGFEIAVKESKPWTVMSSYNLINGTYTSQRDDLLTKILRDEWGFKGFVMSDWFGGKDVVAQMKAGNDLIMPGDPSKSQTIVDAVKNGSLDVKILDRNVERILNIVLQSPSMKKFAFTNRPDLSKDAAISRTAAGEGMILLQNNNAALPLATSGKIAAFGNTSYDFIAGGTGSGDVNRAYTISLIQGLTNAGFKLDEDTKSAYAAYMVTAKAAQPKKKWLFDVVPPIAEMVPTAEMIAQSASQANVALITIGRNAGEGSDRKVEKDFDLSDAEQALIKDISTAFHAKNKKVVVVLNIGGVIETASWRNKVDGILLAWQPGMEAGNAVADVLTGKVNPSGKLATTFPVQYSDVASSKNFPGFPADRPTEVVYEEGIYVGYRYYNTFKVKPAYEFGYGLSYTSFAYTNLSLSSPTFDGNITASITIINKGNKAGKEVVELYLSAPSTKLSKPSEELKAFGKTQLLQPGQTQTLSFTLHPKDLASYDTKSSSWVAEAGKYTIKIGASSSNIKQTNSFTLAKEVMVEKIGNYLAPIVEMNELKNNGN